MKVCTKTGSLTFSTGGIKTNYNKSSNLISDPGQGARQENWKRDSQAIPSVPACTLTLWLSKIPLRRHEPCILGKIMSLWGRKPEQEGSVGCSAATPFSPPGTVSLASSGKGRPGEPLEGGCRPRAGCGNPAPSVPKSARCFAARAPTAGKT